MKKMLLWLATGSLLTLLSGCLAGEVVDPVQPVVTEDSRLAVMAVYTDYTSYGVARIVDSTVTDTFSIQGAKGSGVAVSASGRTLYVTNQATSALTAYRNGTKDAAHVVFNVNVGIGTNPYQVLQVGSKLYVVRWNTNNLLVLSAATGDSIGSIDLSASANDQGAVKAAMAVFAGGKLWVMAQRARADYSFDSAMVIAVDTGTKVAPRGIVLPSQNPSALVVVGDKLYVVSHGSYDSEVNGGVERVDLATAKWEVTVGGLVGANKPKAAVYAGGKFWVTVYRDNWGSTTELCPFDLATGALGAPIVGLGAVDALAATSIRLWASNRAKADKHAVVEIAPVTGNILRSVKTSLPPTGLVVLP